MSFTHIKNTFANNIDQRVILFFEIWCKNFFQLGNEWFKSKLFPSETIKFTEKISPLHIKYPRFKRLLGKLDLWFREASSCFTQQVSRV